MSDEEDLTEDIPPLNRFPDIQGIVTRLVPFWGRTSDVLIPVSLPRLKCLEKPYGLEEHTES
jgi:hypothetical protein